MGDRANVRVISGSSDPGVCLYTHWKGRGLPEILRTALIQGKNSWGYQPHLAATIFICMMDEPAGFLEEIVGLRENYGLGIAVSPPDNEVGRPILVVDCGAKTVSAQDEKIGNNIKTWSFQEFITERPSWKTIQGV